MMLKNGAEFVSGNIYVRQNPLDKAGDSIAGHQHTFDHTTIMFRGSVHVRAVYPDGTVKEGDFVAPSHFLIRADVAHEITALEDDSLLWCVYSHRDPQGRIQQEYTGWDRAYR